MIGNRITALRYVLGRIAQAILVLWAAYTLTYCILNMLPSDPVALMVKAKGTDISSLSGEEISQLEHLYGLDKGPIHAYFAMLFKALHGDLGSSYTYGVPVTSLIIDRIASTLVIGLLAIVLAAVLAFGLAFLAAVTRNGVVRRVLSAVPSVGMSIPSFWLGLLLMQVFCFTLGWLPARGIEGWQSAILPTITMSVAPAATLGRLLMNGFDEVMAEPYVHTALAHGMERGSVIVRHVAKNASLPSLTILGIAVGDTVTGAIVAETVFSRQGLGMLIQQAVMQQDIPVVQGVVILAAAAFVVINLIVDLIYPLLDPRIAQTWGGRS